jgi:hypothetical protein
MNYVVEFNIQHSEFSIQYFLKLDQQEREAGRTQ